MPKSRPETVTDASPLKGTFNWDEDTTPASKLKTGRPVPETDATVTAAPRKISANGFKWHVTADADVQDEVKQTPRSPPPPRSIPAVAVCSPTPKLRPETVMDAYPL